MAPHHPSQRTLRDGASNLVGRRADWRAQMHRAWMRSLLYQSQHATEATDCDCNNKTVITKEWVTAEKSKEFITTAYHNTTLESTDLKAAHKN
eukprot:m.65707 g.65707  ORF g.65707 m.65707 type:complete len:93 (-) comp49819_c0_seq6:778-1056(-)